MYYHNTSYRCIHLHYVITHIYIYVCMYIYTVSKQPKGREPSEDPQISTEQGSCWLDSINISGFHTMSCLDKSDHVCQKNMMTQTSELRASNILVTRYIMIYLQHGSWASLSCLHGPNKKPGIPATPPVWMETCGDVQRWLLPWHWHVILSI